MLTLTPDGWLLTASFIAAGALGLVAGLPLVRHSPGRVSRLGSILVIAMAGALIFVSFSPDVPKTSPASWHARVHNGAYLVLLACVGLSLVLLSCARPTVPPWHGLRNASRVLFPLMLVGIVLSGIDAIAELGRYMLVATLLVWGESVALTATRLRAV